MSYPLPFAPAMPFNATMTDWLKDKALIMLPQQLDIHLKLKIESGLVSHEKSIKLIMLIDVQIEYL